MDKYILNSLLEETDATEPEHNWVRNTSFPNEKTKNKETVHKHERLNHET